MSSSSALESNIETGPYPGLRPFRFDESNQFFGRDQHAGMLIDLLRENRFVAIIGPSGSGKSSLAETVLRTKIQEGLLCSAEREWQFIYFRPGKRAISSLAHVIAHLGVGTQGSEIRTKEAELVAILSSYDNGVERCFKKIGLENNTPILIVVDQFEEVFTSSENKKQQYNFVKNLLHIVHGITFAYETQPGNSFNIYIAITMRSEYEGECAIIPGLVHAINRSHFLIPWMNEEELADAIDEPAHRYGGTVAPELKNHLIAELKREKYQLPILQYCLFRLWNLEKARVVPEGGNDRHTAPRVSLTLKLLEDNGGIYGILSRHATTVLNGLSDQQKIIAKLIFKALVKKTPGEVDSRRLCTLKQLCRLTTKALNENDSVFVKNKDDVSSVVQAFTDHKTNFLLVRRCRGNDATISHTYADDDVVEISHESLISLWDTLAEWALSENKDQFFIQNVYDKSQQWKSDSGVNRLLYFLDIKDYFKLKKLTDQCRWSVPWVELTSSFQEEGYKDVISFRKFVLHNIYFPAIIVLAIIILGPSYWAYNEYRFSTLVALENEIMGGMISDRKNREGENKQINNRLSECREIMDGLKPKYTSVGDPWVPYSVDFEKELYPWQNGTSTAKEDHETEDDHEKVKHLISEGVQSYFNFSSPHDPQAVEKFGEAIRIAETLREKDSQGVVDAYLMKAYRMEGYFFYRKNNYHEAARAFTMALDVAKRSDSNPHEQVPSRIFMDLVAKTFIANHLARSERRLDRLEQTLKAYESMRDYVGAIRKQFGLSGGQLTNAVEEPPELAELKRRYGPYTEEWLISANLGLGSVARQLAVDTKDEDIKAQLKIRSREALEFSFQRLKVSEFEEKMDETLAWIYVTEPFFREQISDREKMLNDVDRWTEADSNSIGNIHTRTLSRCVLSDCSKLDLQKLEDSVRHNKANATPNLVRYAIHLDWLKKCQEGKEKAEKIDWTRFPQSSDVLYLDVDP